MKGYLVISWNPWDCEDIYKKVFLDLDEAHKYMFNYNYDDKKEEQLDIFEVEIGE